MALVTHKPVHIDAVDMNRLQLPSGILTIALLILVGSNGVQFGPQGSIQLALGDLGLPILVFLAPALLLRLSVSRLELGAILFLSSAFVLGTIRAPLPAFDWALVRLLGLVPLIGYYLMARLLVLNGVGARRILTWTFMPGVLVNVAMVLPPTSAFTRSLFEQKNDRLAGALFDPNFNGVFLALAAYCAMFGYTTATGWKRVLLSVTSMYLLLITFSRGGYLVLAALLIWKLISERRIDRRYGFLAVAASMFAAFQFSGLSEETTSHFAERPETVSSRFDFIRVSTDLFLDNPLLGSGLGSSFEVNGHVTHSTPFFVAGDVGILGLIGIGILLVWYPLSILNRDRVSPSAQVAVMTLAVGLAGLTFEAMYQRHWWVLAGMASALPKARQW